MKFPHFESESDRLNFLVRLSALYMEPRGCIKSLATKTGFTHHAILRAIRVGRMKIGMAHAMEKAVNRPDVIRAELFLSKPE